MPSDFCCFFWLNTQAIQFFVCGPRSTVSFLKIYWLLDFLRAPHSLDVEIFLMVFLKDPLPCEGLSISSLAGFLSEFFTPYSQGSRVEIPI